MHGIQVGIVYTGMLQFLCVSAGAMTCGFWTFAIYMRRTSGVVRVGTLIPIGNNIISLLCGILVFSCVFLYPTEAIHQRNKVCCIAVITV